jgi:hypothetical protein
MAELSLVAIRAVDDDLTAIHEPKRPRAHRRGRRPDSVQLSSLGEALGRRRFAELRR